LYKHAHLYIEKVGAGMCSNTHQSVHREHNRSQCLSWLIPLFSEPGLMNQGVFIQTVSKQGYIC